MPREISRQYLSHTVGSRNLTIGIGGQQALVDSPAAKLRASRPRARWRPRTGAIAVGGVPFSRRTTMAPACFAWSS